MMRRLLVAVAIVNFNGCHDTRKALQSLRTVVRIPLLPIVVDNGSDSDEVAILQAEFPLARMHRLQRNAGYARGANWAARLAAEAGASHILFLNNDAWLEDGDLLLTRLLAELDANASLIAVGPNICNAEGPGSIQSAGYRYSLWWPVPRAIRSISSRHEPVFISGCCILVSMERFTQLGGFDPDFFLYGEDVDFALRARRYGYGVAVVPDVSIGHSRGGSIKILSARYVYTALRGNLILILKHAKWYHLPSATLASIAISIGLVYFSIRAGNPSPARAMLESWLDFTAGRWGGLEGFSLEPASPPGSAGLRWP